MGVTPPANNSSNYVTLALETAAVCDDAYFTPAASVNYGTALPFNLASTRPVVVRSTRAVSASALARYLRWTITPSTTGLWDLTFRIRAVATRSSAFVPTDISGCLLWLRGDLGITLNGANVSGWADQSGNGNNASQGTAVSQPPFATNAVNGLPAIQGDGSSRFMTTSAFSIGGSTSMFTAVQPLATTQAGYARILEQDNASTYYLGTTVGGNAYKFIAANNTSPFGTAETGAVQLAPSIVSATYSQASGVGTIYYNGANAINYTFGSSPSGNLALYLMRKDSAAASFWNGYLAEVVVYNRSLAAGELSRVHRYLGARYNVGVP